MLQTFLKLQFCSYLSAAPYCMEADIQKIKDIKVKISEGQFVSFMLSILSLQGELGSEGQIAIDGERVSTAISSRHSPYTGHQQAPLSFATQSIL